MVFVGTSEQEQKDHAIRDGYPLIDGHGDREPNARSMDEENASDQRGKDMLCLEREVLKPEITNLILFRERVSLTVTRP